MVNSTDSAAATKVRADEDACNTLRSNIVRTETWLCDRVIDFLEEFGLTLQQFNILRILRDQDTDPLSTRELAERMINKNPDTSRLTDRLIDKGLVRKRRSPEDGRLVQVFITYDGLKIMSRIDDRMNELDRLFDSLSSDEVKVLNTLLEKLHS